MWHDWMVSCQKFQKILKKLMAIFYKEIFIYAQVWWFKPEILLL